MIKTLVSTEKPSLNELTHYGVLGMKWGIRKDRLTLKTKTGDTITLSEQPPSKLVSFIARHSKKAAAEQDKTAFFNIKGPNGKTVGDITLYKESEDSINVVLITTNKSVRGKGYGTAVMKSAIQIAKDTGCNQVTLEVPGSSPDARHIYEKLGFKEVPSPDIDPDDVWGGLTNMKLDLNDVSHSWLAHRGIVKFPIQLSGSFIKILAKEIDKINSTKELQDLTKRMQLEKQLRELSVSDYTKGMEVAKAILAVGTTAANVNNRSTMLKNLLK